MLTTKTINLVADAGGDASEELGIQPSEVRGIKVTANGAGTLVMTSDGHDWLTYNLAADLPLSVPTMLPIDETGLPVVNWYAPVTVMRSIIATVSGAVEDDEIEITLVFKN